MTSFGREVSQHSERWVVDDRVADFAVIREFSLDDCLGP